MGGAVIIGAARVGYLGSHPLPARRELQRRGRSPPAASPSARSWCSSCWSGWGWSGFLDDFTKIPKERSLGLTSRQKLAGQAW